MMASYNAAIREECFKARIQLCEAERERLWARIDTPYRFETDEGIASLADLFRGRSQLFIHHFTFEPDHMAGCPPAVADGIHGSVLPLANQDITLCAVSRAPLAKLQAYKRRMGWRFRWVSSLDRDFHQSFQLSGGACDTAGMSAFVLRGGVVYHAYYTHHVY
jgi:predicted dithiol-disulfide oxidoreductase (DUF899 family)